MKITVTDIEKKEFENLIVDAFETAMEWAELENTYELSAYCKKYPNLPISEVVVEMLWDGEDVYLNDIEDEEEIFILNKEKILNGIALNIENRPWDCDLENGDAVTVDCIIQYALFNDIVYA